MADMSPSTDPARRPNIIFILIDDLGWKDLSCAGSEFYETPNIDRLAAGGMTFSDAYASAPVCSPSRASVLTGRYPARVGITNFIAGEAQGKLLCTPYLKELPLSERTVASVLKDHGYHTWHVGKWHLGDLPDWPAKHGFERARLRNDVGGPWKGYFDRDGNYLTDRLTDEAIALVERKDDRPFFLNLWYHSVHIPIQAKAEHIERFHAKAKAMGLDKMEAIVEGDYFPCEHKQDKRIQRRVIQSDPEYAAMVYALDENIGRLLRALDEAGETDNTVVFFTSDNGGLATAEGSPTCNAPLAEGKGWMYDGGVREPLIVRWPGHIAPGSSCAVPVVGTDFYPTMLDIAGIDPIPEQHCDGVSILPVLTGGQHLNREAIYWHYPHYSNQGGTPGSSVRMGDYKLIEFFEDGHLELYNLREDISEEHDLADKMPERAVKMQRMLAEWRESIEAKIPQPNPDYRPRNP